ncbi:MAG: xanthine dehydrogenase family protein molybdopterin-binding subunit [Burkholderiaceae bacterium]
MNAPNEIGRFGSGHSVRRIEDPSLVSGTGLYADDAQAEGQLHLALLRSPHAHARILSIDATAALAMPGVVAVYQGADLVAAGVKPLPTVAGFLKPGGGPATSPPRHALAVDVVRFVGEAVVAVLAQTRAQAQAARDAVMVDYEDLPTVVDVFDAVAEGAPQVWAEAPGNIAAQALHGKAAEAAEAFARAAHVVELNLVNQRLSAVPMEPRAALATPDTATGRLTLRLSSQMPSGARNTLCDNVLGIPQDKVRVVVGDVGGGFGMKTGLYPEDAVVAWTALTLGRPVKWVADRSEEFLSTSAGRDVNTTAALALDSQGKILALRVQSLANVGAYATGTGVAIQLLIGPWVGTSIYDIGLIDYRFRAVLTHTTPAGAYRGAGRPEAIYIIERLMDAAARRMGLDGAELRRRNMIRPEQMPYTNPMGQVYDTGHFDSITRQAVAQADWDGFEARAAQSRARGRLRGRGIASFLEWTGGNAFEERVTVNVTADGMIEIFTATMAMGQGIATTYAQLAVDIFGVPIERVRIIQGDTDRGVGFGSAGSRSLFTAGSAVKDGAQRTVDHARDLAADALEVAATDIEYQSGRFAVAGTDKGIDLFELASRQPTRRIDVESVTKVLGPTWPNACHICEVEVDPETGETAIVAYSSVNDVGRAVNPMIVIGQLDGGAVQGIGQALCEQVIYDRSSGQLQTGTLSDYALPRADIIASFKTTLDQSVPSTNNPLGVKGVGELGTIGATPAVVNAVVDALARAGQGAAAEHLQMPLTPEQVWNGLQGRYPSLPRIDIQGA